MIDLSADYWSTYRPTLSASLSVDTSADSQSTITWHIGQYVDPESVYRYGNQESADKLIEYRPIVSIEGCTNRPFPSFRENLTFKPRLSAKPLLWKGAPAAAPVDWKTVRSFAYSSTREQSNKRCENRERDWGETLKIRVLSHALRACEARAVRARKTLTSRFTDFFTDFEEKTDCFAVYCTWWLKRGENHSFEGSGLSVYLGGNTISK